VHPIGIPWLTQEEAPKYGGRSGKCVPPHPMISSLYRKLYSEIKSMDLDEKYQVTLEGTHHGPYADIPSCFVEIGSSESEWSEEEAGSIWATCLKDHYKLCPPLEGEKKELDDLEGGESLVLGTEEGEEREVGADTVRKYMIMSIGGGHYVPKLNDVARLGEQFQIGHALSTYTLSHYIEDPDCPPLIEGGWQRIIDEAISSTQLSMDSDTELLVLLDKKAFKSALKNSIIDHLDRRGIKWYYSVSDVKKLMNKA